MSNKRKIFNDPIYGLISFDHEIVYDLINHRFFQRLRRIHQMGMASLVYPGATHTRFQHALGALHLMYRALYVLRSKGVNISDNELSGAAIAILLHDIGHGPFSHALESKILPVSHEQLSLQIMQLLNLEYKNKLDTAIEIFKGTYHRKFLCQLVSSQLDVDRLDYLIRDSFYTGVAEGVIGYDRIIQMLHVVEDQLVVEEKGLYSIEKFLISRDIMYWQVYLHKTAVAAENILIAYFEEWRKNQTNKKTNQCVTNLTKLVQNPSSSLHSEQIEVFCALDDSDILFHLKQSMNSDSYLEKYFASSLINRRLHKIKFQNVKFKCDQINQIRQKVAQQYMIQEQTADKLIISGMIKNTLYDSSKGEIFIKSTNGKAVPFSKFQRNKTNKNIIAKYFLCNPKIKN